MPDNKYIGKIPNTGNAVIEPVAKPVTKKGKSKVKNGKDLRIKGK